MDLELLSEFPSILREVVDVVPADLRRTRTRDGYFALVEHVWHLADLEQEAFGSRIDRLQSEERPYLPDFRGDAIAQERKYLEQEVQPALERFVRAREQNAARLRSVRDWSRAGVQEGVGEIALRDIPSRMHEHDREHATQVLALLAELKVDAPLPLVRFANGT